MVNFAGGEPQPTIARTVKVPGITMSVSSAPPHILKATVKGGARPSLSFLDLPPNTARSTSTQAGSRTAMPLAPKPTGEPSGDPSHQGETATPSAANLRPQMTTDPSLPQPAGDDAASRTVTAHGLTFLVGSSTAVIGGTTFNIGPGAKPTMQVVDGQTVSIGPGGVTIAGTTAVAQPSQGASMAVIDGTTFTLGPGAKPTAEIIDGKTISIGPGVVSLVSATPDSGSVTSRGPGGTLTAITAGGITFFAGSSIAVIEGTTFTTGPGATPTSKVVNGQTISIGPSGIGFATTTVRTAGLGTISAARPTAPSGSRAPLPTWEGSAVSSRGSGKGVVGVLVAAGVAAVLTWM
ncbi:MAG: hypothetical protein M1839_000955 [Geoglossum umbratile]|nr:MAG: hypothetical protein M1839_000955 [Geoglossum umbratile]